MKLYHCPMTRSERVTWMLRELDVAVELEEVNLWSGAARKPEYLAVNPNGFVPTLVDGELTLFESAAIVMYLADKFPAKMLAPAAGTPARARYQQFMVYGPSTIDPAVELVAYHTRTLPEPHRVPGAAEYGKKRFKRVAKALTTMMGEQPFILGDTFSAADVIVGSGVMWAKLFDLLGDFPALDAYTARLASRPAFAPR